MVTRCRSSAAVHDTVTALEFETKVIGSVETLAKGPPNELVFICDYLPWRLARTDRLR